MPTLLSLLVSSAPIPQATRFGALSSFIAPYGDSLALLLSHTLPCTPTHLMIYIDLSLVRSCIVLDDCFPWSHSTHASTSNRSLGQVCASGINCVVVAIPHRHKTPFPLTHDHIDNKPMAASTWLVTKPGLVLHTNLIKTFFIIFLQKNILVVNIHEKIHYKYKFE